MNRFNEHRIGLRNAGKINPLEIDEYIARGGYDGFKKALAMSPDDVIQEIIDSGLRGRGGAGFPTGTKWKYTRAAQEPCKYAVCNADEGEPGTFKDRIIMEQDPHAYLEGLMIASYAIGAQQAYIYIRGEYYPSIRITQHAIESAKARGFLGTNILGSQYSLKVQIKVGGGSYLCGEESALIESLEGKRGYPRIKPPYPAEKGVFNKPTLVNNVETLSHVPEILRLGASWYRNCGMESSPGTKIFTICGDVQRPGCYETCLGIPLEYLLFDAAGGIRGNNSKGLKTILIGGASGTFLPPSRISINMDYDSLKKEGFLLGSGALIVLAEHRSVRDFLISLMDFFHHESCGKCVPCRIGSRQLFDMVTSLKDLPLKKQEQSLQEILDLSDLMFKTSLCPLGQSPFFPIKSAIQHLKPELLNTAGHKKGQKSKTKP